MSSDALNWAVHQVVRPSSAKLLLLALCDHEGFEKKIFPSVERMSMFTSLDRKTVHAALNRLLDLGIIEVLDGERKGSKGRIKVYTINRNWGGAYIGKNGKKVPGRRGDIGSETGKIGTIIEGGQNREKRTANCTENGTTISAQKRYTESSRKRNQEEGTDSPLPTEGPPVEGEVDLFGERLESVEPKLDLPNWIESEWSELKLDHPAIAGIRKIDEGLVHTIHLRTRQHRLEGETDIDVWHRVFKEIRESRFLCGRTPPGPGRDKSFTLSLGWLLKAANFREIINGKYTSNSTDRHAYDHRTGDRLGPSDQAARHAVERILTRGQRGRTGSD